MTGPPALPRPQPPRPNAPWGTRGSLYNFDTMRLLGEFLGAGTLTIVQRVAQTADRQLATEGATDGGGGFSMGAIVARLGMERGLPLDVCGRVGVVLDALAIAVDLADNLADAEEDAAAGRPLDTSYPDLPYAQLVPLPALLVGAVVAAIPSNFPPPYHSSYAVRRLLGVLDVLVSGQARDLYDTRRVEEISAVQGLLYALPWWVLHGEDHAERGQIESWAVAFGRTWQARRDRIEHPDDAVFRERYEEARRRAAEAWPSGAPFEPGGFLDFDRVVPMNPLEESE